MPKQVAQNIMALLQRAQLSGSEVPMFMQCMAELDKFANQISTQIPKNEE
jgi:tRNA C32,U32 (ribose-2'-O)-methylase TrmJ